MCGLAGWDLTKIKLSVERKVALTAVLATGNDTRGGDAHGFYSPASKQVTKGLGDIAGKTIKMYSSPVLFLHTRKATTGANTVPNAHPFSIGNIIGAHNGIISNHSELNAKYKREHEVDSMHIFSHLNDGLPLDDISGYGAIEWVRRDKPKKIYLCKLTAGDLNVYGIGKHASCKGVIWSSDEDHLKAAVTAANLEAFPFKVEQGVVYYVEDGMFYITEEKLSLGGMGSSYGHWSQGYGWGESETEAREDMLDLGSGLSKREEDRLQTLFGMNWKDKTDAEDWGDEIHKGATYSDDEERRFTTVLNGGSVVDDTDDSIGDHGGFDKDGHWVWNKGPVNKGSSENLQEMIAESIMEGKE